MATNEEAAVPGKIEFYGGYQVYDENGIDLSLLRANLNRSIEQRMEMNRRLGAFAMLLAGRHGRGSISRLDRLEVPAVIRQFLTHKVEFVVGGEVAMLIAGFSSAPQVLELHYQRTPRNLKALASALTPLYPSLRGAPSGNQFKPNERTLRLGLNFALSTEQADFNLLAETPGLGGHLEALAHSTEKTCLGLTVRVLSLKAVVISRLIRATSYDRNLVNLLERTDSPDDLNVME